MDAFKAITEADYGNAIAVCVQDVPLGVSVADLTKEVNAHWTETLEPISITGEDGEYLIRTVCKEGYSHGTHDAWVVCLGRNIKRFFTVETLPDFLKAKISMIKAVSRDYTGTSRAVGEVHDKFYPMDYTIGSDYLDEYEEIGWRVSGSYYCLVLTIAQFDSLEGEQEVDSNGNTRK